MPPPRTVRVLVTDDNPASRYATARALRAAGFEVAEAGTGARTLELCAAEPPEVVILDVHLPDLDGFEICRRLRADPATEQLPIIHVSASFLGDEHRVKGLDAGADAYLTHPVEPLVLVATVRAVLRAREAETALRHSEARLRAVFDRVPVGICLLDEQFRFADVNPALCAVLGRGCELLAGTSLDATVTGLDRERAAGIAAACRSEGQWRGVLAHATGDDRLVHLEWAISRHGIGHQWLALVTDVTERWRVEAERQRALASERTQRSDAEHANRLKDEFLAALSHELRTPLNAIVGWTHVLQSRPPTAEELAKGLEIIQRNARLQAQLIADLLDVSRIVSGKLTLDSVPVQLPELIDAALEGVEPVARAKGVQIERELAPLREAVLGDPSRLQQVVWNLVHNAVKFTPRGGRVRIALRRSDRRAEIEIADNGVGISREFLPHIFERFRQQQRGSSGPHGGLGLGLAIVKQILDLHGGAITAHSDGPDRGAAFTVSLPLLEAAPAPAPSPVRRPRQLDLRHVRALVVDDDPDARALVGRLVADRGAMVAEAADVGQAIDVIEQFNPNVLISDIAMPLKDGYDLIRTVRRRDQHLPAIALTAYAGPEDKARALNFGFQLHVAKPIDAEALLDAVATLTRL